MNRRSSMYIGRSMQPVTSRLF